MLHLITSRTGGDPHRSRRLIKFNALMEFLRDLEPQHLVFSFVFLMTIIICPFSETNKGALTLSLFCHATFDILDGSRDLDIFKMP